MTFIEIELRANSEEIAISLEDDLNLTPEEWNDMGTEEQAHILDQYIEENEGGGVYAYHWDREVDYEDTDV